MVICFQIPEPDIEADYFKAKTTHDDLLNDWSDSSDSGISGNIYKTILC